MDKIDVDAISDAKARKKARRRLRMEAIQRGEIQLPQNALDARKSIFDGRYPGSKEEEWTHYEGLGWVHKLESISFTDSCKQCCITSKWGWKHDMCYTEDGLYIIKAAATDFVLCPYLGRWVRKDSLSAARDHDGKAIKISAWAAANKFFVCDHSKELYHRDTRIRIRNSEKYKYVSGRFCDEFFKQCAQCSEYFEKACVKVRPDMAGNPLCDTCYHQLAFKNVINKHDYAHYPKPITMPKERWGHKTGADGLIYASRKKEVYHDIRLFGVEVETEMNMAGCKKDNLTRHHMAINLRKALGEDFVICKEDGTLTMNGKYSGGPELDPNGTGPTYAGFEVVSAPADLATHRERWVRLEKAEGYKHLRAWDTETCGFHVHVTREALTYLQIARMLIFVNHPKNTLFIQKVAGRGSAKFCRYVEKEPKDALRIDPRTDDNRRQAINLCNQNTVEFRIFRGTVNPKHILRNIEFCDAICDFAYPGSRSLKEMYDYHFFIKFVDANRKKWPLLAGWFGLHKMLTVRLGGKKADKEKFTLRIEEVVEPEIKVKPDGKEPEPKKPKKLAAGGVLVAAAANDDDDE